GSGSNPMRTLSLFLLLALAACDGGDGSATKPDSAGGGSHNQAGHTAQGDHLPPTARPSQVEQFLADLEAVRHPSDGAGLARLLAGDTPRVGESGRWLLEFEAGPLGVAQGGSVFLMVDPFWGWSAPQDLNPSAPGFTRVETEAPGLVLTTEVLQAPLLRIGIGGRELRAGETITIEYGAGPAGARADRHAERGARLWLAVDGDGDGVRAVLPDSPTVDVLPGPPARLNLTVTSTTQPGENARLVLAVLDEVGNANLSLEGTVELSGGEAPPSLAEHFPLKLEGSGQQTIEFQAPQAGIYRFAAVAHVGQQQFPALSNPLRVSADQDSIIWADFHGHSNLSDGTGLPQDYFAYARDVAGLDVVALTDHDHFGVLFLDQNPTMWEEIRTEVAAFNAPGRFVTLLGYEWTNWIHGHRHVLYFGSEGAVISSLDERARDPAGLWGALRGKNAMTFAHHSAGGPIATNWDYAPDPELEPVTEVMSVHGSSEALDSPARIYSPLAGNFARDALERGYRLGFVGSGDGHDGHPGLPQLSPWYGYRPPAKDGTGERMGKGGLAALIGAERTRPSVSAALRARRTYATSGPRILLDAKLEGHGQGAAIAAQSLPRTARLELSIFGTAPLSRLELIRSGKPPQALDLAGSGLDYSGSHELRALGPGEYLYIRVQQVDGGLAWSSPFFLD
ncbi:MAG: CehA/McbA family metallohydrolase, partial [Planctomycetota bacterium]|nr:CehA/McbA family metallohydrolase [Planctomycetota bacterium]